LLVKKKTEGRVRIAFVLTQSLDSPSGLGRFGPLARELAGQGHTVTVLALHYDWSRLSPKRYTDQGVTVAYVGQMHVRKEGPRKLYFSPAQLLWVAMASTLRLARAVAACDAEAIQLCKPQPINALAVRLGRRGRPIYCDCDDYEAETNRFNGVWQRRVVRCFEDGVAGYAAGLTVNTRFTLQRYRDLGVPAARILYIPNGVERSRFAVRPDVMALRERWGLAPSAPIVAYVGTLSNLSHSVDLLLDAFRQVSARLPATRLLLVGGGEDFDSLTALAEQYGTHDQTIFTGRVPPADIPAFLSLATLTVDPVHDDLVARARSPLKIVESLTMGTPVVTGDVGDRRAMLDDGELGVLTPPGDSQALAEGILSLLQAPERRAQMAQAALARRERWYWDQLAGEFARIYAGPDGS
jgi:glycosyltransferase involved in cell wall biosynthesis